MTRMSIANKATTFRRLLHWIVHCPPPIKKPNLALSSFILHGIIFIIFGIKMQNSFRIICMLYSVLLTNRLCILATKMTVRLCHHVVLASQSPQLIQLNPVDCGITLETDAATLMMDKHFSLFTGSDLKQRLVDICEHVTKEHLAKLFINGEKAVKCEPRQGERQHYLNMSYIKAAFSKPSSYLSSCSVFISVTF